MNKKRIKQMNTLLLRRPEQAGCAFLGASVDGGDRLHAQFSRAGTDRRCGRANCNGCSCTACLHFGEQGSCFYGGPMVEEVYPAVRRCDALVMLCANYNDALSANLTACVNRLTALFRQQRFYDKRLFGLIVSGYSGGDLLARQLISALNMNKSFFLPPHFCLLETANERGSLIRLPGIARLAHEFAAQLSRS